MFKNLSCKTSSARDLSRTIRSETPNSFARVAPIEIGKGGPVPQRGARKKGGEARLLGIEGHVRGFYEV
jgi:hypothetical protein